jgi:hypothetical protein
MVISSKGEYGNGRNSFTSHYRGSILKGIYYQAGCDLSGLSGFSISTYDLLIESKFKTEIIAGMVLSVIKFPANELISEIDL